MTLIIGILIGIVVGIVGLIAILMVADNNARRRAKARDAALKRFTDKGVTVVDKGKVLPPTNDEPLFLTDDEPKSGAIWHLSPSDEKVLGMLDLTQGQSITMAQIAKRTKLSVRTVEKNVAKLKKKGLVIVTKKSSKGNTYEVLA